MHKTEAANKKFQKLSKAQKRVAIAKDVLKYLKKGKFVAESGTYVEMPDVAGVVESACTFIEQAPQCCVCALGAVFVAGVIKDCDLGDEALCDTTSAFRYAPLTTGFESNSFMMRDKLEKYFTIEQLDLIENAFEGSSINLPAGVDSRTPDEELPSKYRKTIEFNVGIRNDEKRMTRIMSNIVANNGTFKP